MKLVERNNIKTKLLNSNETFVEFVIEENSELYYVSVINSDFGTFYNVSLESLGDMLNGDLFAHTPALLEQYTDFDGHDISNFKESKFYTYFLLGKTNDNKEE